MQLRQDRRAFDIITFIISLVFPFLFSFVMSLFLNEGFSEILKISIWTALPFAFLLRGIIKLNFKKAYKKMPWSHFTSVGFYINQLDLLKIINLSIYKGEKIEVPKYGGKYFRLSYPEGIEIWVSVNSNNNLESITPFFRGKNVNKIKVVSKVQNPYSIYKGAFSAWAGIEEECFPLIFDNPDFVNHSDISFPEYADITLTAFSQKIKVVENKRNFEGAQFSMAPSDKSSFKLVQTNLDSPRSELPKTHVSFTGIVKDAQLLENSETLMKFYWLSVETLYLVVDVVVDRRMLKSTPRIGNIVDVTGWLAGDWVKH